MKRKFLKLFLGGVLIAGFSGLFVSCKDYEEDIDSLQEQVVANKAACESAVAALETKYQGLVDDLRAKETELKTALQEAAAEAKQAKTDAAAAQKAADKAQTTADKAVADAAAAKAAATAAAAQAKADAIAEAEKLVNAAKAEIEGKLAELKTELQGLIDKKVDKTVFNEKVDEVEQAIKGINAKIVEVEGAIDALGKTVKELTDDVAEKYTELKDLIGKNKTAIEANAEAIGKNAAAIDQNGKDIEKNAGSIKDNAVAIAANADAIEAKAVELQGLITALDKKVDLQKAALEEFAKTEAAKAAAQALADAKAYTDELAKKVKANTDTIKINTEKIAANAAKIDANAIAIGALGERMTLAEGRLDALEAWQEIAKPQIETLQTDMAAAKADIEAHAARLKDCEDDIAKLQEDLATAVGRIDALEDGLNVLTGRVDALAEAVSGRLTSIALAPKNWVAGVPTILFKTIGYNDFADIKDVKARENTALDKYGEGPCQEKEDESYICDYKLWAAKNSTASFRLNPNKLGVDCADWDFIGDNVKEYFGMNMIYDDVHSRAGEPFRPIAIDGDPSIEDGVITFPVRKTAAFEYGQNKDYNMTVVSLEATLKQGLTENEKPGDVVVYSEPQRVADEVINQWQLKISDKNKIEDGVFVGEHHWPETFDEAKDMTPIDMIYDEDFDLMPYIATCWWHGPLYGDEEVHENFVIEDYGLHYRFSVAANEYPISESVPGALTDQQKVLECKDALNGIYKVKAAAGFEYNREAIGRTPIVKVELMDGDKIVRQAFIKLNIIVRRAEDIEYAILFNENEHNLACGDIEYKETVTVEWIREHVLQHLNISHDDFVSEYSLYKGSEKNYKVDTEGAGTVTPMWHFDSDPNTSIIEWVITNCNLLEYYEHKALPFAEKIMPQTWIELYNINPSSANPSKIKLNLQMNIKPAAKEDWPTWSADRVPEQWHGDVYTMNFAKPNDPQEECSGFVFENQLKNAWVGGKWADDMGAYDPCTTFSWELVKVAGKKKVTDFSSVVFDATDDANPIIKLTDGALDANTLKALHENKLYLEIQRVAHVTICDKTWDYTTATIVAQIIKPLTMTLPGSLSVVGDVHDVNPGSRAKVFDFPAGVLTDWMGHKVIPESATISIVDVPRYAWVKDCQGETDPVVIPGWTEMTEPAKVEFEYQTICVPKCGTQTRAESGEQEFITGFNCPELKFKVAYRVWGTPWDVKYTEVTIPAATLTFESPVPAQQPAMAQQQAKDMISALIHEAYQAEPKYTYTEHWLLVRDEMLSMSDGSIDDYIESVVSALPGEEGGNSAWTIETDVEIPGEGGGTQPGGNEPGGDQPGGPCGENCQQITIISNVKYTPAKYINHEPEVLFPPHVCNEMPDRIPSNVAEGEEYHYVEEREGCWVWKHIYTDHEEEEETVPGQYWKFYTCGEGAWKIKVKKITYEDGTALPGYYHFYQTNEAGEVVANGEYIKFVNDSESTISSEFVVKVPVEFTYKLGKINQTIKLTVTPSSTGE